MTSSSDPVSKKALWTGYVMSGLPVLLLIFSGVMKVLKPVKMVEDFVHSGWPESVLVPLGVVELTCTVIYLIPRTSVLGAILLTGYLGGATASNVRGGGPMFLVPVILGVLVWGGLFMRDRRIRALIPLRS